MQLSCMQQELQIKMESSNPVIFSLKGKPYLLTLQPTSRIISVILVFGLFANSNVLIQTDTREWGMGRITLTLHLAFKKIADR